VFSFHSLLVSSRIIHFLPSLLLLLIINRDKALIKVTLNKVITGTLYIFCGWNAVKVQGWQVTVKWRLKQRWL